MTCRGGSHPLPFLYFPLLHTDGDSGYPVRMSTPDSDCDACNRRFDPGAHPVVYESVHLMLHVCPACIEGYITRYGARCINCEGRIVPHTQVAVYKGDHGETLLGHTTVACNPAGNSFYGYWGQGQLNSVFACIEQC